MLLCSTRAVHYASYIRPLARSRGGPDATVRLDFIQRIANVTVAGRRALDLEGGSKDYELERRAGNHATPTPAGQGRDCATVRLFWSALSVRRLVRCKVLQPEDNEAGLVTVWTGRLTCAPLQTLETRHAEQRRRFQRQFAAPTNSRVSRSRVDPDASASLSQSV